MVAPATIVASAFVAVLTSSQLNNESSSAIDDHVPNSLERLCQDKFYSFQELDERKGWYSESANAYNKYRPKYPEILLDEVVSEHITTGNRILEIGSGPGTATVAFAERGFVLDCFEPNADFCGLARANTNSFPLVSIQNAAFEEAPTEGLKFDAVVAATCMHWIPAEIGFPKAAASLRTGGKLILLWNMMLTPKSRIDFERIKIAHQPDNCNDLLVWSDEDTQKEVATTVGVRMMASNLFVNFRSHEMRRSLLYTATQYLGLLSTYSQYIRLSPNVKSNLFGRIRKVIDDELGGQLELSYLSMYHVATKKH